MCFVMFKFSMQQLLRKKKSYITTVLSALFTLIPIVGVQQDLRFWLSLKAGAGQGTKPVVLGWERSASLGRGLLCPAGALPAAGKLWRVLRPLCPACPPSCGKHGQARGMSLMSWTLSRGLEATSGSRQKLRVLEKAALCCLKTPVWKLYIFPPLWMEKDPLWKDISALFIAHKNLITTFVAHSEQKAFLGIACHL